MNVIGYFVDFLKKKSDSTLFYSKNSNSTRFGPWIAQKTWFGRASNAVQKIVCNKTAFNHLNCSIRLTMRSIHAMIGQFSMCLCRLLISVFYLFALSSQFWYTWIIYWLFILIMCIAENESEVLTMSRWCWSWCRHSCYCYCYCHWYSR